MRIFISHPMSRLSDSEILAGIEKLKNNLKLMLRDDIEFIENIYRPVDDIPAGSYKLAYLGQSIQDLNKADLVVFAPEWKYAKECRIVMNVCKEYNIPTMVLI